MNDLEQLHDKINKINQSVYHRFSSQLFGLTQMMTKPLAEVKKTFPGIPKPLPERPTVKVIEKYRRSGSFQSFRDLNYACLGVGHELTDGWCLLFDDQLFSKLLDQVKDLQSESGRFLKCYRGLLSSYFRYEIFTSKSQKNWIHLREYLSDHLQVAKQARPGAGWLTLLEEHRNLLWPKPCERYVKELREGDGDGVHQTLQEGLGVPRESWVWQELVLSQFEVACSHDEQGYKDELDRLLKLLQDNNGMLSKNLVIRCTARLVSRYAQCSSKPEHPALRDAAISYIGNPWLKRTAWDAYVKNQDGRPNETARQMINGWLKRQLIKDFFELLSDDGSADQRRLNYWLRFAPEFEPAIEDMWFALGPHASKHPSADFKDFRNRAKGRLLKLEAPGSPQNNAFIMRLGTMTIVEFGSKNNAAYIYQSEKLPFDLGKTWIRGDSSMAGLKNQQMGYKFNHIRDNWEEKLDAILCPLIDFNPKKERINRHEADSTPQPGITIKKSKFSDPSIPSWEKEVREMGDRYSLPIEDNRPKGGAFWVMDNNPLWIELDHLGFKFKPGKGWWRE